jgi:ectoine hydroxylase-related dioxygenase (phytanoyl-CoA dioxygenase family)
VLPLAQPAMLFAWVALDAVTADNGGMQMAVGSHLLAERLPVDQTVVDTPSGEPYMLTPGRRP